MKELKAGLFLQNVVAFWSKKWYCHNVFFHDKVLKLYIMDQLRGSPP